jgi:hypothetical protein
MLNPRLSTTPNPPPLPWCVLYRTHKYHYSLRRQGNQSNPSDSTEHPKQHAYTQAGSITTIQTIITHINEINPGNTGATYFNCVYPGCQRPVGFSARKEAIAHIRTSHIQEKPFACTAWFVFVWRRHLSAEPSPSDATFARKQDALRHVTTMNGGKKYKCSVW